MKLCKGLIYRDYELLSMRRAHPSRFEDSNVHLVIQRLINTSCYHGFRKYFPLYLYIPGNLKAQKNTGTSCQMEILYSIQTTKFLMKYHLLSFQISVSLIIFFTKHDY